MSIVTRQGDEGLTSLMYGVRVPKDHPRVEAYGAVDELNAALGWARAQGAPPWLQDALLHVQRDLIVLMGELATDPAHRARFEADGFSALGPGHVGWLEEQVRLAEGCLPPARGWALPGADPVSAALEFSRTVCRRAERRVCALRGATGAVSGTVLVYLNRLSDLLWLWARCVERGITPRPAASGNGAQ
jgi:cob(I)alamin adenosyltransferase